MTNSLIPYSFVPGTKAMASEVNANFIALANLVDEVKSFTSNSMDEFGNKVETQLDEALGEKLHCNFSNTVNVSNCITEIPNNIKLILRAGVLTLKAGSVVTIPDGFEADGVTMRFKYETIPSDIEFSASSSVGTCVVTLVYDSSKGKVLARGLAPVSGTTAPSNALFYDVTNNIVKNYTTADGLVGQNYSFPFAYVKATSSVYTEISYVCNGFGYMGQVVWSDKGVKCLIPNGLNSDGTFSNLEYTFANVYLTNLEGQASALCFLGKPTNNSTAINSKMSIRRWTVERYFEQNVPPSFSGNYCKWYNTAENKMYTTSDAGVTWSEESTIYLGTLFKTDSSNIEKFIPARPISLMTREFVERKLSNGLFYSMSINGRSGYIEFFTTAEKNQRAFLVQWGKTSVNANTSLSLYKAYSNTNYLTLATPSMNDIEKYVHCQAFAVSTTGIKISIRSNGGNDTSEEVCWFTIGV